MLAVGWAPCRSRSACQQATQRGHHDPCSVLGTVALESVFVALAMVSAYTWRHTGLGPDVLILSGGPGCVHYLADESLAPLGFRSRS